MGFDHVPAVHFVGANAAVVGTLWSWESVLGPPKWMAVGIKQSELLNEQLCVMCVLVLPVPCQTTDDVRLPPSSLANR